MPDLSPSAFAIWDAAWDCPIGDCESIEAARQRQIAAALRAAANQMSSHHSKSFLYSIADVLKLQTIADELETQ